MEAKSELQEFLETVYKVRDIINNLKKYKGNQHYKKLYSSALNELNRSHKFLKAKISRTSKSTLDEKFKKVDVWVSKLLAETKIDEKLEVIKELEMFWPELEIEFEDLKLNLKSFDVPSEIPMTEYRLDLEEAIKDFDNGCFISSLVLCRRAYEGALVGVYRVHEKNEPYEEFKCKHCKVTLRDKSYFGISKLHEWAIKKGLVTDRLKQVGFLLSDMGSGAAHPPLTQFPRDKEIAKLGITATIALLKELNCNGVVKNDD